MIYAAPDLEKIDRDVLKLISDQRERLKIYTQSAPKRWFGSLRRTSMARAIQGSNSIEGYNATLDEAVAAVEDDPSALDERTETWLAIRGYRNALTSDLLISGGADWRGTTAELSDMSMRSTEKARVGRALRGESEGL